jgi:phosphate uptake regulator
MAKFTVSLPSKWEHFLKLLADDHQIDLDSVISELCEWAFSNPESKKQFEAWLDDAFTPKGEPEDKARSANEDISEDEEEQEEEAEEEAHEDRDYSEDRELKP